MIRMYWTLMWGLASGGAVLAIAAQSNLELAGGLLALTLGAGGISAGMVSGSSGRRTRLKRKRSRSAAHEEPYLRP